MTGVESHVTHASGRRKTICTSAVLAHFGIAPNRYHYCQDREDVKRILRANGWAVRSRMSRLPKSVKTVARLRRWLAEGNGGHGGGAYYVGVPGHAILIGLTGQVLVDTNPRKSDRRPIVHLSVVARGFAT